jgi:hypothetical protein
MGSSLVPISSVRTQRVPVPNEQQRGFYGTTAPFRGAPPVVNMGSSLVPVSSVRTQRVPVPNEQQRGFYGTIAPFRGAPPVVNMGTAVVPVDNVRNLPVAVPNEQQRGFYGTNAPYAQPENVVISNTSGTGRFITENGKTYFVNSKLLYEQLPDYLKSFLNKCVIYDKEANAEAKPTHNMIEKHWITGEPVIRTSFVYEVSNTNQSLYSVDGKDPSEEDFQTYAEGIDWLHDQLYYNTDIRIVHKWKQGDLVVPDMFLMYHAVTGGFSPNDREFVGIWSRKNREDMITI